MVSGTGIRPFARLLDKSKASVWVISPGGKLIYLSLGCSQWLGFDSALLLDRRSVAGAAISDEKLDLIAAALAPPAELMRRGLGLPRDALLAFRWHLNAAEQRYRLSELAIADMYGRGEGVAANQQQASVWRTRSRRANSAKVASKATTKWRSAKASPATTPPTRNMPEPAARPRLQRQPPAKAHTGTPNSAVAGRGHHIQLGAYGTAAAAARQQALLSKQLKRISPNVRLNVVSANHKDGRGMLHRLRTQSMDLGSARFLCGKLKKLLPEHGCFIASGAP